MEMKAELQKQGENIMSGLLFYFASFGMASVLSLLAVLILSKLLGLFGLEATAVSLVWVLLFLIPGLLAFAAFLVSRSLSRHLFRIDYGVIVGYATFSLATLAVIVLFPESQSPGWFVPMLAVIVVATFLSQLIMERMFSSVKTKEPDTSKPADDYDDPKKEEGRDPETRPAFLIRAPEGKSKDK